MSKRIGGLIDYTKLAPAAETPAAVDEQARRMRLDGHGLHDIASGLGMHPEQLRRWLAMAEHGEAAAVHARAWSGNRSPSTPKAT